MTVIAFEKLSFTKNSNAIDEWLNSSQLDPMTNLRLTPTAPSHLIGGRFKLPLVSLPEYRQLSNHSALAQVQKGAISLSSREGYWSTKGSPALTPDGPTPWTFDKWVSDPNLPPFPPMSQISMCCWEWTSLAAINAGATTRKQVSAWLNKIDQASNVAQQNEALFAGDSHSLNVTYKEIGKGRYSAEFRQGSPLPRPGQLISVDGTDHVLVVTNVKQDQVYVASFPAIPFGEIVTEKGMYTKPFHGRLSDWLTININYYPDDINNTNNWLGAQLKFGDPGFLAP
jgi:hypothetical protein